MSHKGQILRTRTDAEEPFEFLHAETTQVIISAFYALHNSSAWFLEAVLEWAGRSSTKRRPQS